MWAAIVEAVGAVWEIVKSITSVIQRISQLNKITAVITCAAEIYLWISTLRGLLDVFASDYGEDMIADLAENVLNITKLQALRKVLDTSEKDIQPLIQKGHELQTRADLVPSNLTGSHKPPYKSTVFTEIIYDYDAYIGTGVLILLFNPEGFNWKPKEPKIIRYVSEKEAAEFISSKSWGNYWRTNYMQSRPRHFNKETTNVITKEKDLTPEQEDLTEYIANQAELPPENRDVIMEAYTDTMLDALDKQRDMSDKFLSSIENGTFGRSYEERGLRVTDILGQKIRAIPQNLKEIITQNPFIKDIAPYTREFKIFSSKMRNARDVLHNARAAGFLDSSKLAIKNAMGRIASIPQLVASELDPIVGYLTELGVNSSRILAGQYTARAKVREKITTRYTRTYGVNTTGQSYENYLKKREDYTAFKRKTDQNWTYKNAPQTKEEWEQAYKEKQKAWKDKLYAEELESMAIEESVIKGVIRDFFFPPECVKNVFT